MPNFKIPYSFYNPGDDYITVPILKKFYKQYSLKLPPLHNRKEYIDGIEAFADLSADNENTVLEWLDETLRQGSKHYYITKFDLGRISAEEILNYDTVVSIVKNTFPTFENLYMVAADHHNELSLVSIEYPNKTTIHLNFSVMLFDKLKVTDEAKIIYPIYVDIDLENNILIGRGKSKSMLYDVNEAGTIEEKNHVTAKTLIIRVINQVRELLDLKLDKGDTVIPSMKKAFYGLMEKYTTTPSEILALLETSRAQSTQINSIVHSVLKDAGIHIYNSQPLQADIENLFEKYIAINYPDKTIFMKDRNAYPIRLKSTDSEKTKVEETSSRDTPLQSTAKYYDNKKSIEFEKSCDSMLLCYYRKDPEYYPESTFHVRFGIVDSYMNLQMSEYVEKEDIDYVLSDIKGFINI